MQQLHLPINKGNIENTRILLIKIAEKINALPTKGNTSLHNHLPTNRFSFMSIHRHTIKSKPQDFDLRAIKKNINLLYDR
ncbi:hypothetical protein [Rickettsiales endosymbiont of Stachyamoeba lipophora]|uniref:hypothetical protein n=1 Tax=Rickettsiales endosymbiont of Stachyamoeba lipophora TaxID=2486578 RepID=UPI000F6503DF|nr:hypothetical protein [Rickettsiales endosymbiont of Stachyamoeba lipophora]AZL15456.1 hypothetical protein EF513_02665 [Rickettsiales endosymbiont of Stachyamoeba lipophora]